VPRELATAGGRERRDAALEQHRDAVSDTGLQFLEASAESRRASAQLSVRGRARPRSTTATRSLAACDRPKRRCNICIVDDCSSTLPSLRAIHHGRRISAARRQGA
jgi:hypothetical protein